MDSPPSWMAEETQNSNPNEGERIYRPHLPQIDQEAQTSPDQPENGNRSTFQLLSDDIDALGMDHRRYQQLIDGLPLVGAIANEHLRQGTLESVSGEWNDQPPAASATQANLKPKEALAIAMDWVGASIYKWQNPEEEAWLKTESGNPRASYFPNIQLVYYAGASNLSDNTPRLAYCLDIYAEEPLSRQLVYVDALNGEVLGSNSLLQTIDSPGSAYTVYSGIQAITTDQTASTSWRLREGKAGSKNIQTYNLKTGTNYSTATDFTNPKNIWGQGDTYTTASLKDAYALDAHFGAEKTYDFYKNIFGRNSVDNNGFALLSYVHYSKGYFNAFWDGLRMTYGDGSAANGNRPLTALDVCGHEITHALTAKTANLNYSYESGALNEGFSDILGTAIEAYARPNKWDWKLGADFAYTIRDMSSPKTYSNPDTYAGTYWYTGTADNGGVHTNSGVVNYWFVLLTQGSGFSDKINDKGYQFDVQGLGMTKAQAVAYRTLTTYLTSTSTYADARRWSMQAAADLVTSNQLAPQDAGEVAYAWDATGVGGGTSSTYARKFTGTTGNESLYGGHLADIITGLGGTDSLWGNAGPDTFVLADPTTQFYALQGTSDLATIQDFNINEDKLQLSKSSTYSCQVNGNDSDLFVTTSGGNELIAKLIGNGAALGNQTFSQATPGLGNWATYV